MTTHQEALDLLRSDACTAEDWGRLLSESRLSDDDVAKALLTHPLADINKMQNGFNDVIHYEWLGQNPIWPILYETNENDSVSRLLDLNTDLLLYAVIAGARGRTRSKAKFAEKSRKAMERWKDYLELRFEVDPETDFFIYFDQAIEALRELQSEFDDSDIESVQESIVGCIKSFELHAVIERKALFQLAFLLEEEFKFKHRGHLMSFLEKS